MTILQSIVIARGVIMLSYEPLWKTMREKDITTYQLIKQGIDKKTIHNLKNNANITMLTAEKLCRILNCDISGIVAFTDITTAKSNNESS